MTWPARKNRSKPRRDYDKQAPYATDKADGWMLSQKDNEYMLRVGAGTAMGSFVRRFWTPLMLSEDLAETDGTPSEVRLFGEDLVAFRDTEGHVGVLHALCPHRQAPLVYARNEDCGLRCIYHGW